MQLSINHCIAICADLGLDSNFVKEIRIEPLRGVAVVYKKDDDGKKYVELTPEGHVAATETVEFDVVRAEVVA